jgi:hypothetical protein
MRDLHRHALDDDFAIVWNAAFRAGRESLQSQLAAQRERDGRDAVVTDATVERAIAAAMRQCRIEGVAMSDKRWDTLFPSKAAWRDAIDAALKDRRP